MPPKFSKLKVANGSKDNTLDKIIQDNSTHTGVDDILGKNFSRIPAEPTEVVAREDNVVAEEGLPELRFTTTGGADDSKPVESQPQKVEKEESVATNDVESGRYSNLHGGMTYDPDQRFGPKGPKFTHATSNNERREPRRRKSDKQDKRDRRARQDKRDKRKRKSRYDDDEEYSEGSDMERKDIRSKQEEESSWLPYIAGGALALGGLILLRRRVKPEEVQEMTNFF